MSLQLQARPTDRQAYPSDVTDDEWAFVAPYLTLCREDAPQRRHELAPFRWSLHLCVRGGVPDAPSSCRLSSGLS